MSNACDHAVDYVYHYIDKELTWTRQLRIRWHLRKCSVCCDAYEFEERLKAVIRQRTRSEAPPELSDRLRALIQQERSGPPDA